MHTNLSFGPKNSHVSFASQRNEVSGDGAKLDALCRGIQ